MTSSAPAAPVLVVGGGVVGSAILFTLAHHGVPATLLEAEPALGLGASGTNSGVLHTGFDSTPGELETALILRSAELRPAVLEALGVPVLHCGAELVPRHPGDAETVAALAENARRNGVEVSVREEDGALLVPGESVTDPIAFTRALAASAVAAGATVEVDAEVVSIEADPEGVRVGLRDGRVLRGAVVVNAAGLHGDDVARLVGDDRFEVYPRKGEFFVFRLPDGATLDHVVLPVPTKRTKGVLVFPTVDGRVVAGPTAVDGDDKDDWTVRPEARAEVLAKAVEQFPALAGLEPEASYAGLRPAGRDVNYVIGSSPVEPRLVNVAAIRSTGLSASLGIADHVLGLLPGLGVDVGEARPTTPIAGPSGPVPSWWGVVAAHRTGDGAAVVDPAGAQPRTEG